MPPIPIIDLNSWNPDCVHQSLKEVVDALEKFTSVKRNFMCYFSRWGLTRVESISSLLELANGLDAHKKNCNISKIVGTSVGIAAGIAGISGFALLSVATAGLAPVIAASAAPALLATGGTVMGTLGGLTAGGTIIAENVIDSTEAGKAKEILAKDNTHFEPLKEFVIQIVEFEDAVEKIMKFDVFIKLMTFFSELRDSCQMGVPYGRDAAFSSRVLDFIDEMPLQSETKKRLTAFLKFIFSSTNRDLRNTFNSIVNSIRNLGVFNQVIGTAFDILGTSINSPQSNFIGIRNLLSVFTRNGGTGAARAVVPIAGGILTAVSVAIDIVILIQASKSVSEGSKSRLAAKVRDIVEDMSKELMILQAIYSHLLP